VGVGVGDGVAVAGRASVGATVSVGVAVGVAVEVGRGVNVGVVVGVLVDVAVTVGVPVAVTVGVGVGMKNAATWLAPFATSDLTRTTPKTMTATRSTLPTNFMYFTYLLGGHSGNGAGSKSAPQAGQTL